MNSPDSSPLSSAQRLKAFLSKLLHFPVARIIVGLLVLLAVPFLFKEFVAKPLLARVISSEETAKNIQHLLSIGVGPRRFIVRYEDVDEARRTDEATGTSCISLRCLVGLQEPCHRNSLRLGGNAVQAE